MDLSDTADQHNARRYSQRGGGSGSMATARPVSLPAEVTDIIISYVDDPGTLCSCMLVCRSWAPASRTILFEEIAIQSPESYDLSVKRVIHSDKFRTYLASTRIFRTYPDHSNAAYSHRLFYDIAGHLPSLRTLTLGNIDWSKHHPRANEPLLLSTFGQLRRLSLRDCCLPSFHFLPRALAAATSLQDLSLFHVTWPHVSPLVPTISQAHKSPALHRLSVYFTATDTVVDPLLRWLCQTCSRNSISHLLLFAHESRESYRNTSAIVLRSDMLDDLTTLGSYMYLTTLKVTMVRNFSLAMFPNVHALFIYADALPAPSYNETQPVQVQAISFWSTLVLMLRDTHFPLRRLYIRNVVSDLLLVDSDQANVVLARDNFSILQLVRFTVMRGRATPKSVLAEMIKRLPNLYSRGILEVEMTLGR
ncbi:hypothetical protein OH76DRAFT_360283 [Lentinus brumalis]|uniref:F-box domain-containing protein n=1 Tax=Lentinus brumalis TaxID=2498619 RepID=A0A371CJ80_9APHY|nr:hypothetical protein OH76DRAFT_360283 [Polyporus brumalis]